VTETTAVHSSAHPRAASAAQRLRSNGASEQVPAVPFEVKKHCNFAVSLDARPRDKTNAAIHHSLVRFVEVFDSEEKANAAGELLPDHGNLVFAIGAGKENARLGSGRPDHNPAFRTPIVCQRWCVFDQLEPEHVDEEPNSGLVVPHNQCD